MIGKSSPIKARKPAMVKSNSEERLAKLAGGVKVVHVGAPSEAEMKSRKEAFEDASAHREGAMAEGIISGGGFALLRSIALVDQEAAKCESSRNTAKEAS